MMGPMLGPARRLNWPLRVSGVQKSAAWATSQPLQVSRQSPGTMRRVSLDFQAHHRNSNITLAIEHPSAPWYPGLCEV